MTELFSKEQVGQHVTVTGQPVNRKNGACLVTPDGEVWIEELSSWPENIAFGGQPGKELTVTGVLSEDNQLPVFIQKNNEPIAQGVPVPQGTNMEQASHRFVLKNATW